jgi:hypothetical protein
VEEEEVIRLVRVGLEVLLVVVVVVVILQEIIGDTLGK